MKKNKCNVVGCNRDVFGASKCKKHYIEFLEKKLFESNQKNICFFDLYVKMANAACTYEEGMEEMRSMFF